MPLLSRLHPYISACHIICSAVHLLSFAVILSSTYETFVTVSNIFEKLSNMWPNMFLYRPSDGSTARVNKILQRRTYLIIVLILVLTCTNITYISIYIIYDIIYV